MVMPSDQAPLARFLCFKLCDGSAMLCNALHFSPQVSSKVCTGCAVRVQETPHAADASLPGRKQVRKFRARGNVALPSETWSTLAGL